MINKERFIQSLPSRTRVPFLRTLFLARNPVFLFVKPCRPKHAPVLVISGPRSGSSWIGAVLGGANNTCYLREPVTSVYMNSGHKRQSFFELEQCEDILSYQQCADVAFSGHPKFDRSVVKYPQQWRRANNTNQLVIKEVNPWLLDYVLPKYQPKVIYLLRHPAAVANSMFSLGWIKGQIEGRLKQYESKTIKNYTDPEQKFWYENGVLQASLQNYVLRTLSHYPNKVTVKYENICKKPVSGFRELYAFCGLNWDLRQESRVNRMSTAKTSIKTGSYELAKDSANMLDGWKKEVNMEQLELLKDGFSTQKPEFYSDGDDWLI